MGVSTKMANYSAVALTMSPGHARLNELSSRMHSVHDDFESEKKARSSVMELKCRAIDEKIMRNKRSEDERLKPLYILIERLGLDIGSERDQLQILDQKLNNDVKDLEANMATEIEDQRKQRKELENRIIIPSNQAIQGQAIHQGHQLQPLDANKIHTRVGGIEGCCYCGYFQGGFSTGGREEDCEEGFGGEIHVWKEQMVLHSS